MRIFCILFFVLFSAGQDANAQKLKTFKPHCGLYYETMEGMLQQKQKEISFYDFRPGQMVASVGAQCCHWEAAYAAATDSVHFYLEDIDTTYFNSRQADFAWDYYNRLRQTPMTSTYTLVLGDEEKTNLPAGIFDKVLIINSFHEFSNQPAMLADIASKLKAGGILYIDEALARKSGELHGICNKQIYLEPELIAIFRQNGFEYVDGIEMNFRKSVPVRKIFAFRKRS